VKHIWRLLELDWEVEVSHTYREANRCADALSIIGCSADYETLTYEVCPYHLSELLAADCTGLSTPRLITRVIVFFPGLGPLVHKKNSNICSLIDLVKYL
jgi:hypothetical protein